MSYTITKEQVCFLASGLHSTSDKLREWFPEAFEPEWEEVPLSDCRIMSWADGIVSLAVIREGEKSDLPFRILPDINSPMAGNYKIESGKIWRKK